MNGCATCSKFLMLIALFGILELRTAVASDTTTLYPFTGYPLRLNYEDFLMNLGIPTESVAIVFQDEERCIFRLPMSDWQGMRGEIHGIYNIHNHEMIDVRFIVFSHTFDEVSTILQRIYFKLDAVSYVSMDSFLRERPEWMIVMSSRLDRRIEDQQLALFGTSDYRIEVWNESFFQGDPAVTILFRLIE
ncbi:hypothetical protein PVA45_04015 [Entomospira entomophila]|uniref:Uncharacterized protein n=1 Tax=Entomospira entomophila TaxID=2719988 RepID=A0A968G8U0_9SPIO|nr:hypothetical protein [Entomospira entomophilus]NIZ40677.1 hypothetical protein [Entomospira entomophilus]WDI34890.1 hypothetical protein PVA45_04015 [Entomospira entomophilus]